MKRYNFYVSTMTQALRGRDFLSRVGIRAFVSRNTDIHAGAGCGFSIAVMDNGEKAAQILQKQHIQITRREIV